MSHGRRYDDNEWQSALEQAHARWKNLPMKKKQGKAPSMQWCYDCNAWHLNEPANQQ